MSGIIFDLDFTLIDATADIQTALDRALKPERAAAPAQSLIRRWAPEGVGPLVGNAIHAAGLPLLPELHQRVLARFLRHYAAEPVRYSQVFPGVVDALARLEAEGRPLGICTNKPAALTRRVLTALNLDRFFRHVVSAEAGGKRMPDPEPLLSASHALGPGEAWFVGVSASAARAAESAGLPFLLFDHGGETVPAGPRLAGRFAHYDALPGLVAENSRHLV